MLFYEMNKGTQDSSGIWEQDYLDINEAGFYYMVGLQTEMWSEIQ